MAAEVRVLERDQWDQWYGKLDRAFGVAQEAEGERSLWRDLTEVERSLAAWDGDEIVGTAGAFSFRLSVPGGALVPAAAVTMVSVASTHRRRGVLTSMMRRQLDDIREKGDEPLAVLTASEPAIYGRFGYGTGSLRMVLDVDTIRAGLLPPEGAADVRLRLVPPREALEACEAVYARVVPGRPGMPARQPGWERLPVNDPPSERQGAGNLLCVLAETQGEVRGYARYAVKPHWGGRGPDGTVVVHDVEALDPVTYGALWNYLFTIDLTSKLTARARPVDDPLLHLVADLRRCGVSVMEDLFVRPVDVGAALEARTYAAPVDVVLAVTDPFCPWNEGRWRLSGDTDGVVCARTTAAADLALSVRELGAAYLGGFRLGALAGAGRVREERAGALAAASAAFGSDVQPWLPHGF